MSKWLGHRRDSMRSRKKIRVWEKKDDQFIRALSSASPNRPAPPYKSAESSDPQNSLEKIKRQLASGFCRNLLQGPLLKRSKTVQSKTLSNRLATLFSGEETRVVSKLES